MKKIYNIVVVGSCCCCWPVACFLLLCIAASQKATSWTGGLGEWTGAWASDGITGGAGRAAWASGGVGNHLLEGWQSETICIAVVTATSPIPPCRSRGYSPTPCRPCPIPPCADSLSHASRGVPPCKSQV